MSVLEEWPPEGSRVRVKDQVSTCEPDALTGCSSGSRRVAGQRAAHRLPGDERRSCWQVKSAAPPVGQQDHDPRSNSSDRRARYQSYFVGAGADHKRAHRLPSDFQKRTRAEGKSLLAGLLTKRTSRSMPTATGSP